MSWQESQQDSAAVRTATSLLSRIDTDQSPAAAELLPLVYDELRRLAGAYMRGERFDHTLQPTALVHEAFMRLVEQPGARPVEWKGRAHFLGVAAKAMRRVLVDHARAHNAAKRGGAGAYAPGGRLWERGTLDEAVAAAGGELGTQLIDLDGAMDKLAALDPRAARVVELRFFGGLTIQEAAAVLDVATSTVEDDWALARAWLGRELSGGDEAVSLTDFQRIRELFLAARRLGGPARDLYLSEACADDATLRAEIDSLLANHDRPSAGLIETPVVGSSGTLMIRALSRAPERIGQYRIVRLIGEGAMGSVYEAEQDNPRRRVALKLLRPGLVSAQVLKRFSLEAQILGRLHHPGIAQVYEAGTFGETDAAIQPYFAMEFIDGPVLARFLTESRPGTRDKLRLIARICDAVQHAHDRAVIHRDLKPANIVVVPGDEPQPKVLDFGVARLADPDHRVTTLQTGIGQIIGTVAYMSPEQARGETTLDARSDVYAIGIIAYEAFAGRLPYDVSGRPLHEALQVIQTADPGP